LDRAFHAFRTDAEAGLETGAVPVRDYILLDFFRTFEEWLDNQREQTAIYDLCGLGPSATLEDFVPCFREQSDVFQSGLRLAGRLNRLQAQNADLSEFLGG